MVRRLRIVPRWLLATAVILGLAAGHAATAADGPVADADVVAWVAKRVEERQPAPAEKRFDEIGWARDLRTAIRLGKQHHRPVFLFTMDGRINTGRC
jgi:hypothetical protein